MRFTLVEKLGVVGIIMALLFFCFIVGISIYGLYLAFNASIILGIIALVVEPSPFVFGICGLFGTNIPMIIQQWINFPV